MRARRYWPCQRPRVHDRIDTVVVRLDTTNKQCYVDTVLGAENASPVRATLTQVPGGVWEEKLSDYYVNNGLGYVHNFNVYDTRQFAGSGTHWTDYPPALARNYQGTATPGPIPHILSGNYVSRYRLDGDTCDYRVRSARGAGRRCLAGLQHHSSDTRSGAEWDIHLERP